MATLFENEFQSESDQKPNSDVNGNFEEYFIFDNNTLLLFIDGSIFKRNF